MSNNDLKKSNAGMRILTRIISIIALVYIFAMIILMAYFAFTGAEENVIMAIIIGLFIGSTIIYAILMFFHDKKQQALKEAKKKHK